MAVSKIPFKLSEVKKEFGSSSMKTCGSTAKLNIPFNCSQFAGTSSFTSTHTIIVGRVVHPLFGSIVGYDEDIKGIDTGMVQQNYIKGDTSKRSKLKALTFIRTPIVPADYTGGSDITSNVLTPAPVANRSKLILSFVDASFTLYYQKDGTFTTGKSQNDDNDSEVSKSIFLYLESKINKKVDMSLEYIN